jgi:hypothetical protein
MMIGCKHYRLDWRCWFGFHGWAKEGQWTDGDILKCQRLDSRGNKCGAFKHVRWKRCSCGVKEN